MQRILQCNTPQFCFLLAVYYTILNSSFLLKAFVYLPSTGLTISMVLFLITLPLYLFSIFFSLFSILTIKYIEKPCLILLMWLSAILSYGYVYHGVVFDDFSPMMGTIEQTNWKELSPFLTPSFMLWILLLGVAPSIWIFKVNIIHAHWKKETLIKLCSILLYPLFYIVIIWPFMAIFRPIVHLSGLSARAPYQIIPNNFVENSYKYYQQKLSSKLPYAYIGLDAKRPSRTLNKKNKLLVIVIGEAARGMNFSLNGYPRETNPYTARQEVISFTQVTSCGTATRVSVPCIFSNLPYTQFSNLKANHQDNLLDLLKRVNLNLFWFDNNGAGGCQGVCKNIDSINTNGLDGELIPKLAAKITQFKGRDTLIVVHLQGSHGPSYYAKYPKEFRKYTPDCRKNELRSCNAKSLLNAYDNSLIYTDFVLSEMIKVLKTQSSLWDSALIYTSDHGESIGEKGLYGHCAPYRLAPIEQIHVPLIVWLSPELIQEGKISLQSLQHKAKYQRFSHDVLFHSVLGVLNISTKAYDKRLDLFQSCRASV
jgi:lipid A ethanolaminephosphotransferase